MLFNISNGYKERGSYEKALVRAWKLHSKFRRLEGAIAIGLEEGISRVVLRIKRWVPCAEAKLENRYEFIPDDKDLEPLKFWETKNYSSILTSVDGFWKRGAAGGPIIFKTNKDGKVEFLRGLSKKTEEKKRSAVGE